MRVEQIILREIRMRLKAPFETSFGVTQDRRILLVDVMADGVRGWGEITTVEAPFYNSETTDTAWHIFSAFIAPLVVGQTFESAADLSPLLDPIRGHSMAKAGMENALWDVEAQQKRLPLWKLVGGTRNEIACGVSLGIRDSPAALVDKVEEELRSGYQRIKLKIKPGKDLDYVAAVRRAFPDILLSVDANSAYRLADANHLAKFDEFSRWSGMTFFRTQNSRHNCERRSAWTNASTIPTTLLVRSIRAHAALSISSWAESAVTAALERCTMYAANATCPSGAEACWNRA